MVSRLFFISTDGPMAVQMSFVCHTKQVVMIAESFLKKSVSSGAPMYMDLTLPFVHMFKNRISCHFVENA